MTQTPLIGVDRGICFLADDEELVDYALGHDDEVGRNTVVVEGGKMHVAFVLALEALQVTGLVREDRVPKLLGAGGR